MIDFEHVSKEYKKGGKLAIMAGVGPMGLGALTYALHRDVRPSMVVVTDVNEDRLARAEALFPPAEVKEKDGIDLHFVNTGKMENPAAELREMTGGDTNQEIAERLHMSVATVKTHILNMLEKTGFKNRTELAVRARESGLVILNRKN